MGIGMTVITAPEKSDEILRFIRGPKARRAWIIGEVVKGGGIARVE